MFVVVSPEFPGANDRERVMYKKKDRTTDFRLFIDHGKYRAAGPEERKHLVYDCMRRSLALLKDKKVPDLDVDALIADVEAIAADEGWARP